VTSFAAGTPNYGWRISYVSGGSLRFVSREGAASTRPALAVNYTPTDQIPTSPSAPTGLSATVSSNQINLAWTDNSNNETLFKIERKTGAGGTYSQIATVAANVASYGDASVTGGNIYYYRVRAMNISVDSGYSNEASAIVAPPNYMWGTLEYKYDPFGNLVQTKAGGVITSVTYDLRGRKTSMSDPDMGGWSYAYNALGELKRQTDAKGQVSTMTYDVLGRMTSRTEPDLVSQWFYDSYPTTAPEWNASLLAPLTGNCAKGVGKLCYASADNGFRRLLTYDSLGRPSELNTFIDTAYVVTTAYVASGIHIGKVDTLTYPDNFTTKNVYNAFGYLSEVRNNADGRLFWKAQSLSPSGQVMQEALGDPGVLTATRSYDVMDRLKTATASGAVGAVQNLAYSYDPIGNVTQRVDNVDAVTENFTYDSLNRLLQASGPGLVTRSLDYDAIGNITYKSDAGLYTYGAKPHAVTSVAGTVNANYSYDANGNLTSGAGRSLTYMSFNLPLTLAQGSDSFQYTYNVDHERVRLVVTRSSGVYTTVYLHPAGGNALLYEKETQPNGTVEHRHYVNAMGLVGVYVTKNVYAAGDGPGMRYFHKDHLGSIAAITNEAGAPIERFAYEAFGKRRFPSGTADPANTLFGITTERGFTEHEHLDEIGLIHMNGRVYDPTLGRFMTPDPTVAYPYNLQSFNRYSYVLNNPLRFIDPTGFECEEECDEGGGGGGGDPGGGDSGGGDLSGGDDFGGGTGIGSSAGGGVGPVGTAGGQGAGADLTTQPATSNRAVDFSVTGNGLQTPDNQGSGLSLGIPGILGGLQTAALTLAGQYLLEPASHEYGFRWHICDASNPGCSTGTAFGGGLRSSYPGADGQIVKDGQTYYVFGWRDSGAITTNINYDDLSIKNTTLSTHVFCCGEVVLRFGQQGTSVYLDVTGKGVNSSGLNAAANWAAGYFGFAGNIDAIRGYVQAIGQWSSYGAIANPYAPPSP